MPCLLLPPFPIPSHHSASFAKQPDTNKNELTKNWDPYKKKKIEQDETKDKRKIYPTKRSIRASAINYESCTWCLQKIN